ncbi:MAG: adenylate/guanylate cyclase domain-containing protein [Cyanobacteria bacterium P01_A01_bin.114]
MRLTDRLSIQSKLMLMLLFVSMGSIVLIAYLGYSNGRSALRETIENGLTSIRSTKAHQIESYFENTRAETKTLSEDLMVVGAMRDFRNAYPQLTDKNIAVDQLSNLRNFYREVFIPTLAANSGGSPNTETYLPVPTSARYLQYHYIAKNPNPPNRKALLQDAAEGSQYSAVHGRFHDRLRNIVREFGYYDMFLIDADTGSILYTVEKEVDYGTNLYVGPYANSNLAKVFEAALEGDRGFVTLTDFAPYRPSYGQPAAFIASPIYDGAQLIGVLAFQISTDEINRVMTSNQNWQQVGLGQTGETYLVGADYRLRSDARLLIEDPAAYLETLQATGTDPDSIQLIEQGNTSILQQEVRSPGMTAAIEERKTGLELIKGYRGEPVLRAYERLDTQNIDLVIVSEITRGEAFAPIDSFSRRVLISMAGLVVAITLLAIWLANKFLKPIRTLSEGFQKLSEGEINAHVKIDSKDEFGELGTAFNNMIRKIKKSTHQAEAKHQENEALLQSILPGAIAQRLKNGERNIADRFQNVTILFCDFIRFRDLTHTLEPEAAIALLNEIVTTFDSAVDRHGVEKIKTNGSEYMAVGGMSIPCLDHAKRIVDFGVEMLRIIHRIDREHGINLKCRIGVHTGDVMAGVVGQHKFTYDLWGDAVSLAHGVQASGQWNAISITRPVRDRLIDIYECDEAGSLELKGQPVPIWTVKI